MRTRTPVRAIAVVLLLASWSACNAPADPSDTLRAHPTVEPIAAAFNAGSQSTTYSVRLHNNEIFAVELTARWSGPNCGTTSEPEQTVGLERDRNDNWGATTFTWTHPHPPCAATPTHDDTTVQLTVRWNGGSATCSYRGAGPGTGSPCQYN